MSQKNTPTSKTTSRNAYFPISSSLWLYYAGWALITVCTAAGIAVVFVGMGLNWSFLRTFAWSGGLIVFGILAMIVFRAFGDLVARVTDIHNILEQQFGMQDSEE